MSETKNLLLHLKNLCNIAGVSGNESNVSDYIINNLPNTCTYEIDPLGNLIVNKKGENSSKADKKLMIVAHMDEVGFIINAITEDGMLKFSSVGGIDKRVVFQRAVEIGENKVYGIIGANPIHLLKSDEVDQAVKIENMYIDIGATTKEEAENLISLG
ncbi:MAG: M42 family peptidase, partial [Oscillospiraceae bacterium]